MRRALSLGMAILVGAGRRMAPLALLLSLAAVAAACPTCTDGLGQNDPNGRAIAAGFYYSILFMMSMPFLIVATFGSMAYLSIRRARAANSVTVAGVENPAEPPAAGGR